MITTLAQAAEQSSSNFGAGFHWPGGMDLINACRDMEPGIALILVMAGIVYLVFGYCLFKPLVTFNVAAVGGALGWLLGHSTHWMHPYAGAAFGAILAGVIAWSQVNYAVALMGGIYGALIGAMVWNLALPPQFAWAGAFVGLVACGLLSFLIFRGCVMAFTSFQGSVMLILGGIGLLSKHPEWIDQIATHLAKHAYLFPIMLAIPTIAGMIYQQFQYPAPAPKKQGGGSSGGGGSGH